MGLAGAQLSVTNQYAYRTSYEVGLWGDVKKYALDIDSGVLPVDANGNPVNAAIWSVATQLDAQAAVIGAVVQIVGWDINRRILTINDSTNAGRSVPLGQVVVVATSVPQQRLVRRDPAVTAQQVFDYLRGDQSNEGSSRHDFPHSIAYSRRHRLSGAVPVGAPNLPYDDAGNPGYPAFAASKASRAGTVYVGANDGMLHAFDDTVANGGKETWAYVPKALLRERSQRHQPPDISGVPIGSADLPTRRNTAVLAQVLCQCHAPGVGH